MNKYLRVYNDSAILNRELEFPANLVWAEISFECPLVVKNNVTPSVVNVTRLYVIDDNMKIKLAGELHHASPCSDLSINKSLNLTIGYIGDQC